MSTDEVQVEIHLRSFIKPSHALPEAPSEFSLLNVASGGEPYLSWPIRVAIELGGVLNIRVILLSG